MCFSSVPSLLHGVVGKSVAFGSGPQVCPGSLMCSPRDLGKFLSFPLLWFLHLQLETEYALLKY